MVRNGLSMKAKDLQRYLNLVKAERLGYHDEAKLRYRDRNLRQADRVRAEMFFPPTCSYCPKLMHVLEKPN